MNVLLYDIMRVWCQEIQSWNQASPIHAAVKYDMVLWHDTSTPVVGLITRLIKGTRSHRQENIYVR